LLAGDVRVDRPFSAEGAADQVRESIFPRRRLRCDAGQDDLLPIKTGLPGQEVGVGDALERVDLVDQLDVDGVRVVVNDRRNAVDIPRNRRARGERARGVPDRGPIAERSRFLITGPDLFRNDRARIAGRVASDARIKPGILRVGLA
jgi:hypothetical protein